MGKFSKYLLKHGKPFTISVPNGKGTIKVMFYDGYITLRSIQPGVHFGREIHITQRSWVRLLAQMARPTRLMQGPSVDRNALERKYFQGLALIEASKRAEKRERATTAGSEAQKARYARARERAQRKADASR